jgi:hypothetical protein
VRKGPAPYTLLPVALPVINLRTVMCVVSDRGKLQSLLRHAGGLRCRVESRYCRSISRECAGITRYAYVNSLFNKLATDCLFSASHLFEYVLFVSFFFQIFILLKQLQLITKTGTGKFDDILLTNTFFLLF